MPKPLIFQTYTFHGLRMHIAFFPKSRHPAMWVVYP
jgi:hypothetical protein